MRDLCDLLLDVLRFLRHRDSDRACCLVIGLTGWVSDRHCLELADWFRAILENRRQQAQQKKSNGGRG